MTSAQCIIRVWLLSPPPPPPPTKVLWTAQGQIMIQNSSKKRMGTTSNIFWLMLQSRYSTFVILAMVHVNVHTCISFLDHMHVQIPTSNVALVNSTECIWPVTPQPVQKPSPSFISSPTLPPKVHFYLLPPSGIQTSCITACLV